MDAHAGSLEKLLELAEKDEAAGLGDAPWPPHFRKMEGEAPRVAPSRARTTTKKAAKSKRVKMPLIVVANSPDKKAALAGLERWKEKHPQAAKLLAVDDVLVDSMRGRSSTWTRIRVNLRNVPEKLRHRRKLPIRTTIQPASGVRLTANVANHLLNPVRRLIRFHGAARLRVARTCNQPVLLSVRQRRKCAM
jgi:hypothetical protein